MRIYEGSPRQDFEEVFRSIGAFLDGHGMRDILLLEVPDGFIVQGLVTAGASTSARGRTPSARLNKETLSFLDDDIAKFMEEAARAAGSPRADLPTITAGSTSGRCASSATGSTARSPRTCSCSSRTARTSSGSSWAARRAATTSSPSSRKDDVDQLLSHAPELRAKPAASPEAPGWHRPTAPGP